MEQDKKILVLQLCLSCIDTLKDVVNLSQCCKRLYDQIQSPSVWTLQLWEKLFINKYGYWFRKNLDIQHIGFDHFKRIARSIQNFKDGICRLSVFDFGGELEYMIKWHIWKNHIIIKLIRSCLVYSLETGKKWKFDTTGARTDIYHQYLGLIDQNQWILVDVITRRRIQTGQLEYQDYCEIYMHHDGMCFAGLHGCLWSISYETGTIARTFLEIKVKHIFLDKNRNFIITQLPLQILHTTDPQYDFMPRTDNRTWVSSRHNSTVMESVQKGNGLLLRSFDLNTNPPTVTELPHPVSAMNDISDFDGDINVETVRSGTMAQFGLRWVDLGSEYSLVLHKRVVWTEKNHLIVLQPHTNQKYSLECSHENLVLEETVVVNEELDLKLLTRCEKGNKLVVWDFSVEPPTEPSPSKRRKKSVIPIDFTKDVEIIHLYPEDNKP